MLAVNAFAGSSRRGAIVCVAPGNSPMKIGLRVRSLTKRIAARTSWKRYVRHSMGLKAPRGWGWVTNPRRAAYNRVYNRTTPGCAAALFLWTAPFVSLVVG